jgi:hypothetical protein
MPWTADLHVAFTDDPARATVRVQIIDDADAADFVLIDDAPGAEAGACQSTTAPRLVAISDRSSAGGGPVIHLSSNGPADYRIYVHSQILSQRDAAALIIGAGGGHRHIRAASLGAG